MDTTKINKSAKVLGIFVMFCLLFSLFTVRVSASTIRQGNYYLNLYGNTGAQMQGRSVRMYHSGSGIDQSFTRSSYAGQTVIVSNYNQEYAFNYNTYDGTCITWKLASTSIDDSALYRSGSKIELVHHRGMPLQTAGFYDHAVVGWGGVAGYQTWIWGW